ncbi:hypothetical protein G5V59_25855 [Nocardioides sp. W3-2-3]|nr:hypothetical protein [Nocardioides convexus]
MPDHGVGWLRGIVDGLVLVMMGIATALLVFVIGLLPLVGAIIGFVLGLVLSGRLLAGEPGVPAAGGARPRPGAARGPDEAAPRRDARLRRVRPGLLPDPPRRGRGDAGGGRRGDVPRPGGVGSPPAVTGCGKPSPKSAPVA